MLVKELISDCSTINKLENAQGISIDINNGSGGVYIRRHMNRELLFKFLNHSELLQGVEARIVDLCYSEALSLASERHMGQVDRAGLPYLNHLITVAKGCETMEQKVVALLHDILEDTKTTEQELRDKFPKKLVDSIVAMTRKKGEYYFDGYIRRVMLDPIAKAVKIQDLKHNMDISRLACLSQKDMERLSRYHAAYIFLKNN